VDPAAGRLAAQPAFDVLAVAVILLAAKAAEAPGAPPQGGAAQGAFRLGSPRARGRNALPVPHRSVVVALVGTLSLSICVAHDSSLQLVASHERHMKRHMTGL